MVERLAALPVAIPFGVAALIAATHRFLPRRALDVIAVVTSGVVLVLCVALAVAASDGPLVHWFGGWVPFGAEPIGIAFAVQPIGAWIASLAALLVTGSFVFSWRYFEDVAGLYHGIVLVFLAGMCGFCLTGDLFNFFVFFEVMGVTAFALTGYKNDLRGAIQGAVAFAITNSVAAILLLLGIGLVYAQTGALNMARAGATLASRPLDPVTTAAFALVVAGLLTKAAQFPFHLWLPDAHSVAPVPISVLFSGAMVLMGFWGVAHTWWIVFHVPFAPHEGLVRGVLLAIALLSSVVGGLSALLQTDLKRLLAFSTISHGGSILAGIALLSPAGMAGSSVLLIGQGMVKGALFMIAGRLLNRHGSTDIRDLHGRARRQPFLSGLFFTASLALTGVPGFLSWAGESFVDEASARVSLEWAPWVLMLGSALTGAALLAAGGHIFFGWGPTPEQEEEQDKHVSGERSEERREQAPTREMLIPPAVLVALAFALTWVPQLGPHAERWATVLTQPSLTSDKVLRGTLLPVQPVGEVHLKTHAALTGGIVCALAATLAAAWLSRKKIPAWVRHAATQLATPVHTMQSGIVCDYVLWMSVGLALLGAIFMLQAG